jgi:acyl-CoA synthetase (AMP-forming)/AMP-acid ligase II
VSRSALSAYLGFDAPMAPTTQRIPELDFVPTIPALLRRAVELRPDHHFVISEGQRVPYAEIERWSRALSRTLVVAGVGKATRVGILMPQGASWVAAMLAAARIGALVMPISTLAAPPELARMLQLGDVEHVITYGSVHGRIQIDRLAAAVPRLARSRGTLYDPDVPYLRRVWMLGEGGAPDWVSPLVPCDDTSLVSDEVLDAMAEAVTPADQFVTIFTSGTTKQPKAVVHTHGAQVRQAASLATVRGGSPDDRVFAAAPFVWVGGLTLTLLTSMFMCSTILCQEKFDPAEALDLMEAEQVTAVQMWHTARERLLRHPTYASRNLGFVANNSLGPPTSAENQTFKLPIGMTESCGQYTRPARLADLQVPADLVKGSCGRPMPGVEIRIADPETNKTLAEDEPGEICLRGHTVMVGLYKREREECFDAEGWYHTEDRGYIRSGYVFFLGRMTALIKTAGANVAPSEVESALMEMDGVERAFVVGIDDAERGQVVAAVILPAPGVEVDLEAVRLACRDSLAAYKLPRIVVTVADRDIPYLPTGKVDTRALAARVADWAAAKASA